MAPYKVTLTLEVEIDASRDDALVTEEGSIETAAIQMAHEHICGGGHADHVFETDQRAELISA
jgi:hypothetical protein